MPEEFLTVEDVLDRARSLGIDLSERTFRYYSVMGLLPRPSKLPGDGRVHQYPPTILARLEEIRRLQAGGLPLKQIKKHLDNPALVPADGLVELATRAAEVDCGGAPVAAWIAARLQATITRLATGSTEAAGELQLLATMLDAHEALLRRQLPA